MVNKKKLTAGVAALILCITGVTYGTLAYFTDKDTRANVITIGHVTGTLTETDEHMRDDNTTGKDYTNVKPGDVLDKDPTVTLDKESEDAYVRVSINYEGLTKEQALAIENNLDISAGCVAALILCITGVTYGTLAYFTDKDTRANVITIGHVTGTLTETDEHMRDDNTTGKDYTNVKPGDVLDKDPTVTLDKESEDAYVRVSINYEGLTKEQALAIENNLDISAGWTKSEDGYYYYNEILSNKTGAINSSKVFSKVTIPTEWGNEIAGITFNINVKAEFIQSDNFTPVTDEAGNITGWGNVAIEKSLK